MIRWQASGDLPLFGRPSALGLVIGAALFSLSLTPSLIPRSGILQGVLGGICFAIGYLLGHALVALYHWVLERPAPSARHLRRTLLLALVTGALLVGWGLWNATGWQNGIHKAMGIAPVESARPFTILAVAGTLAGLLVFLGRLFRRLWKVISAQLERLLPRRLALVIGLGLAFLLFWSIGNDFVLRRGLTALDEGYAAIDRFVPSGQPAPAEPSQAGSPASLVGWEGLGAEGRNWVLSAPDAAAIGSATGSPAATPLRVYVGLNNAASSEERAALALAEALRTGAFDRGTLVIATPTGTGWMDPAGLQPLEYLTGGDVATVAVQYSYLPSWLSLIVQPEYGSDTAEAVFHAIYGHWRSLPPDSRPKLYLFGLSLGARNGEFAAIAPETLGDPVQGALWVGAPFAATGWRQVLAGRQPDSPAWAARFGDGAIIRITTQAHQLDAASAPWGKVRLVYLVYPSDPIAFFSTDTLWRRPDWLKGERAPDVSTELQWYPAVTFLQLVVDMMTATSPPPGLGHVYAGADYLYAWNEVLGADTPPARMEALRAILTDQGL